MPFKNRLSLFLSYFLSGGLISQCHVGCRGYFCHLHTFKAYPPDPLAKLPDAIARPLELLPMLSDLQTLWLGPHSPGLGPQVIGPRPLIHEPDL